MDKPDKLEFDDLHNKNVAIYEYQVKKAYIKAIKRACELSFNKSLDSDGAFFFKNDKKLNKAIDEVIKSLYDDVYQITALGMDREWDLSTEYSNKQTIYIYGEELDKIPAEYKTKYLAVNKDAKKAFIDRKTNGLGLSEKVWKNTTQFKQELELALELGIGKGTSAANLSRNVRQYLNEPDKLFRRVRDKNGELRLSKAAKAYKPGQGVYRSSYKNALRLTRNETNFSYEAASKKKRQQQDFVVGIKIQVSKNHNPALDKGGIRCVELQGKYPKDFDFTNKWHVNCKCHSIDILKTRDELFEDIARMEDNKEPAKQSVNSVDSLPDSFTGYIKENQKMWDNWKNKPRFLVNVNDY